MDVTPYTVIDTTSHYNQIDENETTEKNLEEFLNIIESNESQFLESESFNEMKKGLISLESGINSVTIPVYKEDIGSIIAYSLNTN
jgi:hypothetical protein